MKRILITGKNSYIGNKFEEWVSQWPDDYQVDKISVRGDSWKEQDWSIYDVILHVAGIAHNSSKKSLEDLYYKVNRDLTVSIAKKAKSEGVNQFIFMSSIIVFGTKNECIDKDTVPNPDNFYGDSKLQAEIELEKLVDESFLIAVIRPPMVYGEGSKGNYPKLAKLAKLTPIFPKYENKRSMIYVENLAEFIRLTIKNENTGFFHPQNQEYTITYELVQAIRENEGKKVILTTWINRMIENSLNLNIINKVFGDLYYDGGFFEKNTQYNVFNLRESIQRTESRINND